VPRRGRRALAPLLAVASLLGLGIGAVAGGQLRRSLSQGPPLVAASDVVAAADGMLYVATAAGRVQVHDPDGRFREGWQLEAGAGPARLRLVPPGRLEVATAGSGRLHVFDRSGALLASTRDPGAYERLGARPPPAAGARPPPAAGAPRLAIEDGAVVRLDPPPRAIVLAPPPAPLAWFGASPVPALTLLLTASGLGLVFGVALAGARRRA